MLLLLHFLILLCTYRCTASPADFIESPDNALQSRQTSSSAKRQNLYRIPNTALSLFYFPPGEGLDRVDMVRTFSRFRRAINDRLKTSNDSHVPPQISMALHNVRIEIGRPPMLPDRADMTWEHAEHVARAVNLKMHKEGFKERWCVVLLGAGLSNIGYMKVVERVKP